MITPDKAARNARRFAEIVGEEALRDDATTLQMYHLVASGGADPDDALGSLLTLQRVFAATALKEVARLQATRCPDMGAHASRDLLSRRAEAAGKRAEVLHHLLLAIQAEREAQAALTGTPWRDALDWVWGKAEELAQRREQGPL